MLSHASASSKSANAMPAANDVFVEPRSRHVAFFSCCCVYLAFVCVGNGSRGNGTAQHSEDGSGLVRGA